MGPEVILDCISLICGKYRFDFGLDKYSLPYVCIFPLKREVIQTIESRTLTDCALQILPLIFKQKTYRYRKP